MKNNKIKNLSQRIWGWAGSASVRTKIFGIVLGTTFILSLSFIYQVRFALNNVLEIKSKEQGISISRNVAARSTDLILINDLFSLHKLLQETKEYYPDVWYAFVLDQNDQVLAHTFGDGFPLELIEINRVGPEKFQNTVFFNAGEEMIWDVAVPIFGGNAGTARVGISDRSVSQTMFNLTRQLGWTIMAVLIGSLLAATILTWVLTRPILNLVEATNKIAQGDFSPRVKRWADDEIGDLEDAFNQMAAGLERIDIIRQEKEQLRKQLLDGVITAQEDERRRIARELHDSTSQSLSSLIIGLKNLADSSVNPEINRQVENLRDITSMTLDDVHSLAIRLRPSVLDDLGLEAAIERLVKNWQERHKVQVDMLLRIGDLRLPGDIETILYRIVQEAMTNIAKHAQANSVSILIERRNKQVEAIIEDDGVGFDIKNAMSSGRLGLLGMKERAELFDGNLIIESKEGRGTGLFVNIPLEYETERKND